jgi:FtsH-binding integral membrane protein
MRVIFDIECPTCKSYYIKYLDKFRFYKLMALSLGMMAFGCVITKAMLDEHDADPVILLSLLLGAILIIVGFVTAIYSMVKQVAISKAVYKCQLCKCQFA